MNQKVRIWDIVLAVLLVALCLSVWFLPRPAGASATVSADGKVLAVLPLDTDTSFRLEDGTEVIVEKGTVRVEHATCDDKLCQAMGKISHAGETLLCLPNRISVVISGEVDAYVG